MYSKKILFFVATFFIYFNFFTLAVQADQLNDSQMTVGQAQEILNINLDSDTLDEQDVPAQIEQPNLPPDELYKAKIIAVGEEQTQEIYGGYTEKLKKVTIIILDGKEKGEVVDTVIGGLEGIESSPNAHVGQKVVVAKSYKIDQTVTYNIIDQYRLDALLIIVIIFFILAIIFGKWKGFGSLLGLSFSIVILAQYIVPKIIAGENPLLVTLIGALIISASSLFLAHGFNKRTSISWLSTMITLAIALFISKLFVNFSYLFGVGTEESFYLQNIGIAQIDLRGLLLAGIVIGTLGVLDDITTAQTAVVGEIHQANHRLSMRELYKRGLVVGREHIASLVNTLVLAYAGASLPLFILFAINHGTPIWFKINSQLVAEELVRTVIGSMSLILAVPITTILAAYFLRNEKIKAETEGDSHIHHH